MKPLLILLESREILTESIIRGVGIYSWFFRFCYGTLFLISSMYVKLLNPTPLIYITEPKPIKMSRIFVKSVVCFDYFFVEWSGLVCCFSFSFLDFNETLFLFTRNNRDNLLNLSIESVVSLFCFFRFFMWNPFFNEERVF